MDWTTLDAERLRALAEQGLSGSRIAAVLGVTRNSVCGFAHRNGIQLRSHAGTPGSGRKPDRDQDLLLATLIREGMTARECASVMERHTASIYARAKRIGVSFKDNRYG